MEQSWSSFHTVLIVMTANQNGNQMPFLGTRISLQWRHNEHDGVPNHQPHDCLFNRLFGRRSNKTSKLGVTGLCVGNWPATGEFPAQRASNAETVSIWWCHHVRYSPCLLVSISTVVRFRGYSPSLRAKSPQLAIRAGAGDISQVSPDWTTRAMPCRAWYSIWQYINQKPGNTQEHLLFTQLSIYPGLSGAPLTFNGAPRNIHGYLDRYGFNENIEYHMHVESAISLGSYYMYPGTLSLGQISSTCSWSANQLQCLD